MWHNHPFSQRNKTAERAVVVVVVVGGGERGGWTKFGKRGIGNIGGIVCTPHPFWWGVLDVLPNFQKRGLDRTSTLRGGCWGKEGVTFRGWGCNVYKKKLKSEIFNNKKSL